MWKWTYRVLAVVCIALIAGYHILDEAGASKAVKMSVAYACVGLVAALQTAIIVRAVVRRRGTQQPDKPETESPETK